MDSQDHLSTYQGRLKTFTDSWPFKKPNASLSKHQMAKAGFYYLQGDCVKCYYCQKELEGWLEEDNPYEEHKVHADYCPFLKMFPKPPNTVTIYQAIVLERDRLLLEIDRRFECWLQVIRSVNECGITKIARGFDKQRRR